jgi:hypothetical protein
MTGKEYHHAGRSQATIAFKKQKNRRAIAFFFLDAGLVP